ncbi:unnamed protein product [Symbiodinium pilosum]|uniref:Uncharacterized protein n=1 Tax=Symbiodinium pilosum TaxID=2952 RepID=A0A812PD99_SYMPI|nr:unnamed protein product [Symbiodinium pilosum]
MAGVADPAIPQPHAIYVGYNERRHRTCTGMCMDSKRSVFVDEGLHVRSEDVAFQHGVTCRTGAGTTQLKLLHLVD